MSFREVDEVKNEREVEKKNLGYPKTVTPEQQKHVDDALSMIEKSLMPKIKDDDVNKEESK